METTMRAIEKIQIGEVVHLQKIEGYLPSDSRSKKRWHSFLVKCYKTFELLSLIQKHLFVRVLLVEPDDVAFIEDGMVAAADDVGTDNANIIDSIVLPLERRALQSIDRGRTRDEKSWEY